MSKKRRNGLARRATLFAGISAAGALWLAAPAVAQDFTVTSLGDDNSPGTLRAQVAQAELNPGADRILFDSGLSGTIALTGGSIAIGDDLEMAGPGSDVVTVDGSRRDRIFVVGGQPETITVEISGLTLANGLQDMNGGAIHSTNADLTIDNSVLTANRSVAFGGGVFSDLGGKLMIRDSTLSGNSAAVMGGAVFAGNNDVLIQGSTFDQNQAKAGGAVAFGYSVDPRTVQIENSTLDSNVAEDFGGAVTPFTGSPPAGNANPSLEIRSSTITGNDGGQVGGGISGGSLVSIENSIVAGNTATNGPDLYSGTVFGGCGCGQDTTFDIGFSLIGDPSQALVNETVAGSNILNTDPGLDPLADNGGPTRTRAIQPGSPVLDQGSSSLSTDQRGESRPVDDPGVPDSSATGANGADMGAFELESDEPVATDPSKAGDPFEILGSTPKKNGTAIVKVRVRDRGALTLVGRNRLRTVRKRANANGVLKFRATPKGKLKRNLNERGRARVLVRFRFDPDAGDVLGKGRRLSLVKGGKNR